MRSSTRTVAPTVEPLTLEEALAHLREEPGEHDAHIERLIRAARQWAEDATRRALLTQTWIAYFDGFPTVIEVPRPPLQSVTSISYVVDDGSTAVLDSSVYTIDTDSEPALIYPGYGQVWPSPRVQPKSVWVEFVAGYGSAAGDIPEPILNAIRLHVSRHYEIREPVITGTIVQDSDADLAALRPYQVAGF